MIIIIIVISLVGLGRDVSFFRQNDEAKYVNHNVYNMSNKSMIPLYVGLLYNTCVLFTKIELIKFFALKFLKIMHIKNVFSINDY